jgi:hypothetical protein
MNKSYSTNTAMTFRNLAQLPCSYLDHKDTAMVVNLGIMRVTNICNICHHLQTYLYNEFEKQNESWRWCISYFHFLNSAFHSVF